MSSRTKTIETGRAFATGVLSTALLSTFYSLRPRPRGRNNEFGCTIGTIACLIVALGLRIGVISNHWDELTQDRDAYLGIATSLFEGRGYSVANSTVATAFRPPLYPILLSLGFCILSQPVAVAALNVFAGLLTVWLTMRLGERLQLGPFRFIAALMVAIDPLLLRYTSQPMTESLCACLAAFWLWSAIAIWPSTRDERSVKGLWSGISFGLLVLCRPTFWPIAGLCGLNWIYSQWHARKTDATSLGRFNHMVWLWSVSGLLLVVAPWLVRNWIVFGTPILTTTHGGYTLLLGNNPTFQEEVVQKPWGTVWQRNSLLTWQSDLEVQMERDLGQATSEVKRDAWQSNRAKGFIFANWRQFGAAALHRIRSLWNTVPQAESTESAKGFLLTAVGWYYTIVLTAGAIGMLVTLRRSDRLICLPLFAMVVTIQIAHLFYWTNSRMRAPLTPAIALFAVAAIARTRQSVNDSH